MVDDGLRTDNTGGNGGREKLGGLPENNETREEIEGERRGERERETRARRTEQCRVVCESQRPHFGSLGNGPDSTRPPHRKNKTTGADSEHILLTAAS